MHLLPVGLSRVISNERRKLNAAVVAATVVAALLLLVSPANMAAEVAGSELNYEIGPGMSADLTERLDIHAHSPLSGNLRLDDFLEHPGELLAVGQIGDVFFDPTCTPNTLACNSPFFAAPTISLSENQHRVAQSDLSVLSLSVAHEEEPVPHPTAAWVFGFAILLVGLVSSWARLG